MHIPCVRARVFCFNVLKIKFYIFQAGFELVYLPTGPPPKGLNRVRARSPSVYVMQEMDPRNWCMLGKLDPYTLNFAYYNVRYQFIQDDSF